MSRSPYSSKPSLSQLELAPPTAQPSPRCCLRCTESAPPLSQAVPHLTIDAIVDPISRRRASPPHCHQPLPSAPRRSSTDHGVVVTDFLSRRRFLLCFTEQIFHVAIVAVLTVNPLSPCSRCSATTPDRTRARSAPASQPASSSATHRRRRRQGPVLRPHHPCSAAALFTSPTSSIQKPNQHRSLSPQLPLPASIEALSLSRVLSIW
ncbi:hypothetical protein M0R45_026309 [Rubus argutus]|uniref:Uncharacterized protein n=1 Tax=Rubus argutus TaxID=59490 RepID=A0AAW1WZQ3_RUBAR